MMKILSTGFYCSDLVRTNVGLLVNKNAKASPTQNFTRSTSRCSSKCKPSIQHLICFKDWNADMVLSIIYSAMNLKCMLADTHGQKMQVLPCSKIMILEDHNEPVLRMAVSKAASLLGAADVLITDVIDWKHDYVSRVFSEMADVIFVSTEKHGCMRSFAKYSLVPILCMRSRRHASIQSMATIMSILEDYGTLQSMKICYVGAPHPVLNDYLLLCPMLGANFVFKCCCNEFPVSPLLMKTGQTMCEKSATSVKQTTTTFEALYCSTVIISGPTTKKKEKIPEFKFNLQDIARSTNCPWTYYHTLPRGEEVDDELFWNRRTRTFNAYKNTLYIAAALMAFAVKAYKF
ncbi:ornithine carbamoyltransferase-like [Anticarsia gemmatalis]|uniref:ornithine carbamoyltransferase-like n=1 Tax=Anticarsia gemmatalis TaxID=129554 RepID=UPI003F774377